MRKSLLFLIVFLILFATALFLLKQNKIISNPGQLSKDSTKPQQNSSEIPQTSIVAENLDTPWGIVFLPDKSILVTERGGSVRLINTNGQLENNPVAKIGIVKEISEGGLLGIAIHPDFASNKYVYLYFTYSGTENATLNRVVRMKFENKSLTNEVIIVDRIPGAPFHNGGRIKFGPDKNLYITTGDAQNPSLAQSTNSLAGKILRATDDGKPVSGNPFNNLVYSYGHRNPQGLAWDGSGQLWVTEHGPSGIWPNCCQDEINRIEKGGNYGWPESVGDKALPRTIAPALHSGRDIWAPAGAAIVNNSLFFAGLRGSALYEYNTVEKKIVEHFKNEYGRLRDVVVGPDNMLYITTSNRDGRGTPQMGDDKIIRINPNKL